MTSREIIQRVLAHDNPPRIGMGYSDYEGQPRMNDFAGCGPAPDPNHPETDWEDDGAGGETQTDEWGCVWRRLQGRSQGGEVLRPVLESWADLDTYVPPTFGDPARYADCPAVREKCADQYLLGWVPVGCAFNQARYLRKMEQYLEDCAAEPDQVWRLNEMVNNVTLQQVEIYGDLGADGIFFCEDWGIEDRLLVSPRMWHQLFEPFFARLIERAHRRGLTVWMHSCGMIRDILPSLVDLGLDVFQLDQPELCGLEFLAEYADRTTFYSPVDIQKVLPSGDRRQIEAHAREMLRLLGGHGGGFVAKDYPDNPGIGVDPLWQHWGYEVFATEGVYPQK
jgi:hypothetical protein